MTRSKPPSSLDYDGHLHELALGNWRRALTARDVPRAEINARTLTRSHDKFWRFTGNMHLALAQLCGGHLAAAFDAFASAARAYPEARELVSIAQVQCAHVHLETHSPQRALEALSNIVMTPDSRYWRALACARLSREDDARALADAIDDHLLRAHVLVELGESLETLRSAFALVPDDALASSRAVVPVAFALATRLLADHRENQAKAILTRVTEASDTLLHWPIPYVRALHRTEQYAAFLHLWRDGDLDPDEVAEAIHFVNS